MSYSRRTRMAVLGAVLSTALAVGMAGTAIAFSAPVTPTARLVLDGSPASSGGPSTTPAPAGRTPAP